LGRSIPSGVAPHHTTSHLHSALRISTSHFTSFRLASHSHHFSLSHVHSFRFLASSRLRGEEERLRRHQPPRRVFTKRGNLRLPSLFYTSCFGCGGMLQQKAVCSFPPTSISAFGLMTRRTGPGHQRGDRADDTFLEFYISDEIDTDRECHQCRCRACDHYIRSLLQSQSCNPIPLQITFHIIYCCFRTTQLRGDVIVRRKALARPQQSS